MTPPADAPKIRSEEKVALVLGAGGARGLAQIGVIEALELRGINIVAIAGSSSGALVGGLHACGKLPAYRDWLLTLDRRAMLRLLDPGFGRSALFEGTRLIDALREIAGSPKIEDLPIDFTAVAVDVMRQREVWLREGDMWDAIRASFAIPGLFTPHMIHGRALVDGGLLAPLPIAATRLSDAHRLIAVDMHGWPQRPPGEPAQEGAPSGELPKSNGGSWFRAWLRSGPLWDAIRASFAIPGLFTPHTVHGRELVDGGLLAPLPIAATRLSDAHRLIAVDMHGWPQRPPGEPADNTQPAHESLRTRFGDWVEHKLGMAGSDTDIGLLEVMSRSLDTMQAQISRVQLALDPPELVIRIPRDACQFYEFWRAKELIGVGRREAGKALDAAGY